MLDRYSYIRVESYTLQNFLTAIGATIEEEFLSSDSNLRNLVLDVKLDTYEIDLSGEDLYEDLYLQKMCIDKDVCTFVIKSDLLYCDLEEYEDKLIRYIKVYGKDNSTIRFKDVNIKCNEPVLSSKINFSTYMVLGIKNLDILGNDSMVDLPKEFFILKDAFEKSDSFANLIFDTTYLIGDMSVLVLMGTMWSQDYKEYVNILLNKKRNKNICLVIDLPVVNMSILLRAFLRELVKQGKKQKLQEPFRLIFVIKDEDKLNFIDKMYRCFTEFVRY